MKTLSQDLKAPIGMIERAWLRKPAAIIFCMIEIPIAVVFNIIYGTYSGVKKTLLHYFDAWRGF